VEIRIAVEERIMWLIAGQPVRNIKMNRKSFFAGTLVGFLLLWRMLGFAAATVRGSTVSQAPEPPLISTPARPEALARPAIPVTGNEPAQIGAWQVLGLLGLGAAILIVLILMGARRMGSNSSKRRNPRKRS
jgi:hypothetical protein